MLFDLGCLHGVGIDVLTHAQGYQMRLSKITNEVSAFQNDLLIALKSWMLELSKNLKIITSQSNISVSLMQSRNMTPSKILCKASYNGRSLNLISSIRVRRAENSDGQSWKNFSRPWTRINCFHSPMILWFLIGLRLDQGNGPKKSWLISIQYVKFLPEQSSTAI